MKFDRVARLEHGLMIGDAFRFCTWNALAFVDQLPRFGFLAALQIGVIEEIHGVELIAGVAPCALVASAAAAMAAMLESIISCQRPSRRKICEGMCVA